MTTPIPLFALCTVRWRRVESEAIHAQIAQIAKIVPRVYVFSENKYLIINCLPHPYLSQRFIFRESMNRQFIRISGVIHTLMHTAM